MNKHHNIADKLMNECTGVMMIDEEGNYQGHYTRKQLYDKLIADGHDKQAVDIYIFCGLEKCTAWHPIPEELAVLQQEGA